MFIDLKIIIFDLNIAILESKFAIFVLKNTDLNPDFQFNIVKIPKIHKTHTFYKSDCLPQTHKTHIKKSKIKNLHKIQQKTHKTDKKPTKPTQKNPQNPHFFGS